MSLETKTTTGHCTWVYNEAQETFGNKDFSQFRWSEVDHKPVLATSQRHFSIPLSYEGQFPERISAFITEHDISNPNKNPLSGSSSWKSPMSDFPGSKTIWDSKEDIPCIAQSNCDTGFSFLSEQNSHVLSHIKKEPWACDPPQDFQNYLPTMVVNKQCMYSEHVKLKTEVHLHTCVLCRAEFDTWEALNIHLQTHGVLTQHEEQAVNVDLQTHSVLTQHEEEAVNVHPQTHGVLTQHMEDPDIAKMNDAGQDNADIQYRLSQHVQQFSDHVIITHMMTHKSDDPHKHSECNSACITQEMLSRMMMTPIGENPYKCTVCNKTFTMSHHLYRHMMIHTGEKPHKCSDCGKQFMRAGNLKKHMRTHTGEKPYKCSQCSKQFIQAAHLKRHMGTHTGGKPLKFKTAPESPQQTIPK